MVLTQQKMRIKPRTWDSRSRVSQGKRARPGLPSRPLSVLSSAKSTQGRAGAEIPSAPHSPRACVAVLAQRGRRFLVPGSMCAGCGWQALLQGRGLWASSPRSQAGDLALLEVSGARPSAAAGERKAEKGSLGPPQLGSPAVRPALNSAQSRGLPLAPWHSRGSGFSRPGPRPRTLPSASAPDARTSEQLLQNEGISLTSLRPRSSLARIQSRAQSSSNHSVARGSSYSDWPGPGSRALLVLWAESEPPELDG